MNETNNDTWPYEHTEADEKPTHRKPYDQERDMEKTAIWRILGKPRGRHAA